MNTPDTGYATLGDAYADSLVQPGTTFTNDVVNRAGANDANSSDPYSIPWTEDQEKRKRLSDAQIQRDNLLESMGDNPTMEDIVAWGEYDATIKQLTEELGLGPKEYTPGVEGGWQEEHAKDEAEKDKIEAMKRVDAEDLWKGLVNCDSLLHLDQYLEAQGFSAGSEGIMEVWQTVEGILGREDFEALWKEIEPDSTATIMSSEAYEAQGKIPPSIDADYGTINIGGKDVKIIPWSWEHDKHSYDVVDTYKGTVTEFNWARFMLDWSFEDDGAGGQNIGTNIVNAALLGDKILSSFDQSYATVDVLNIDGKERAVIKVSDSAWDAISKTADKTETDLINGTEITLDADHVQGEFGYIYFENGKMILKPLVYPGDKYLVFQGDRYVDVTNQLRRDYEVPGEMAEWIEEAIKKTGLSFDLPQ